MGPYSDSTVDLAWMRRIAIALGALTLGACATPTVDNIKSEPVAFTVTVAAPWDQVGECIAANYSKIMVVNYRPMVRESRAEIIPMYVANSAQGMPMFVFDVRGSNNKTIVTLKRPKVFANAALDGEARGMITYCGGGEAE
jgi:hypothetical protein